jgi:hypothetical protein
MPEGFWFFNTPGSNPDTKPNTNTMNGFVLGIELRVKEGCGWGVPPCTITYGNEQWYVFIPYRAHTLGRIITMTNDHPTM